MDLKEYIQHHKNEFDDQKMSSKSDAIFEAQLKGELHKPKKVRLMYAKYASIAASIALLISVFFFIQSDSISIEKESLLASLTANSAGERLEGVYRFDEEFTKEDEKIIETLLKILHEDENANVKIATIDALLKFPTNEKIRKSLISAIAKEKLPLVQIKLIKSLSFLRENRAQKPLEDIINSQETYPIVKNNATLAINQLKQ